MAKLIYITNVSLDGYIEDAHGNFDWTEPDDEVFAFITDLLRPAGTYLYGRRLYEAMAVWETDPALAAQSELMGDFAHVWQAADKVVDSTTLQDVVDRQIRLERDFDPDPIRGLNFRRRRSPRRGANFAAHASGRARRRVSLLSPDRRRASMQCLETAQFQLDGLDRRRFEGVECVPNDDPASTPLSPTTWSVPRVHGLGCMAGVTCRPLDVGWVQLVRSHRQ